MQNMYYIHGYKDTVDRTIICLTFQQSVQKLSNINFNRKKFPVQGLVEYKCH